MTVEFWFKASFFTGMTQYLMTLYHKETSREYFAIYYNSTEMLICAPFGIDSVTST